MEDIGDIVYARHATHVVKVGHTSRTRGEDTTLMRIIFVAFTSLGVGEKARFARRFLLSPSNVSIWVFTLTGNWSSSRSTTPKHLVWPLYRMTDLLYSTSQVKVVPYPQGILPTQLPKKNA